MLTSSFFTYTGDGRVSIARSMPRGIVVPTYPLLAPGSWFRSVPKHEYRKRYFDQLSKLDAQRVWDELHKITDGVEPVLLCWETLKTPEDWCHRRFVAEWLGDKLGVTISEWSLSALLNTPKEERQVFDLPKLDPQKALF